jgi:hypothetical protein
MRGKQKPHDFAFGMWALMILAGLAFLSVALEVGPIIEPAIFNAP